MAKHRWDTRNNTVWGGPALRPRAGSGTPSRHLAAADAQVQQTGTSTPAKPATGGDDNAEFGSSVESSADRGTITTPLRTSSTGSG